MIGKPVPKQPSGFLETIKGFVSFGDVLHHETFIKAEAMSEGAPALIRQVMEVIEKGELQIPSADDLLSIIIQSSIENTQQGLLSLDQYLHQKHTLQVRSTAIVTLAKFSQIRSAPRLLLIIEDPDENRDLRLQSLSAVSLLPEGTSLDGLLVVLAEPDAVLVASTLDVIEARPDAFSFKETISAVEHLASSENEQIQMRALEVLGAVGEIDIIERICMLPMRGNTVLRSITTMIQRVMARPRNILFLRPENFEQLVGTLLAKLGYTEIKVTRPTADGGVDVIASRPGHGLSGQRTERVVVQCKRCARHATDEKVLQSFIEVVSQSEASSGVFITTAGFTNYARELAAKNRHIDIIDGTALQGHLDTAFGAGEYCIRQRV